MLNKTFQSKYKHAFVVFHPAAHEVNNMTPIEMTWRQSMKVSTPITKTWITQRWAQQTHGIFTRLAR